MELTELKEKAQRNLQVLTNKMAELDNQRQQIMAEICRYQGEVRALSSLETKDDKEEDRPAKNAERVEKIKP